MKIIEKSTNVYEMGGKGYQLSLLNKVCAVPEFFVLAFDSADEINNKSNQQNILKKFDEYQFDIVAVRSSATKEDSASYSFAGMFETTLNVSRNNLIKEIKKILCSLKEKRVTEYCKLNSIDTNDLKMRIVIQRMIDSRISGVCFSKTKKNDNLLIEACMGLGEAIVGSNVTPDIYEVNRKNKEVEYCKINYQSKKMIKMDGIEKFVPVPIYQRYYKKMQDNEIKELTNLVLKIEKELQYNACDIEWAYEADKLYILQVREFTGI